MGKKMPKRYLKRIEGFEISDREMEILERLFGEDERLEISDQRLEELTRTTKPLVRFSRRVTQKSDRYVLDSDGDLYFIEDVDPRKVDFTIAAKPTKLAEEVVNSDSYKTIVTIHDYGVPFYFKPSIAEVLAQIPEEEVGRCIAFETNYIGFTKDLEYHVSNTKLYGRKRE